MVYISRLHSCKVSWLLLMYLFTITAGKKKNKKKYIYLNSVNLRPIYNEFNS